MFYRAPERRVSPPPILHVELLRTLSASVINDAMQKLPDPNTTESDKVSVEYYADYHGKVNLETIEGHSRGPAGPPGRYRRAKAATRWLSVALALASTRRTSPIGRQWVAPCLPVFRD